MNEKKSEIAQLTRDAIASIPPVEGMRIEVNEAGIYGREVAGTMWWDVPVRGVPEPRLRVALYEVMAEVEGVLQDDRGYDIHLVPDVFYDMEQAEAAAK